MGYSARSWHVSCHIRLLQGVPTNPRLSAVRRLVWYSCICIFVLRCPSFLFKKLPGVALQGKKRCSFDVPHGRFHRSQTAGPGYGDIPDKWPFGFAATCTEIAAGYCGGNSYQSCPRVTWVARRQPSSRQKLFFQSLMDKGCTCLRNPEFLTG